MFSNDIGYNTKEITCKGFNQYTGVGIQDDNGYPCEQDFVEAYAVHIRPDTFRVTELPVGFTIMFQQHPEQFQEMVSMAYVPMEDDKPTLSVSNWNAWMDELEDVESIVKQIKEETEAKVQNILQEQFATIDPEPDDEDMTYLEAFDLLTTRARNWWFNTKFDIDEIRSIKFAVGIVQDTMITTLDIIRMYISSNSYKGLIDFDTQELVEEVPEHIQDLVDYDQEMADALDMEISDYNQMQEENRRKSEFYAMFQYRMKYGLGVKAREDLGKKIVEWAQGL